MAKDGRIWLSHSGIEGLERCPRCFWLSYKKGIRQPEGIVSRLANRFDSVLKNYFDIFRPLGELPPMVEGKIEGRLQNPFVEAYFVPIDKNFGFWGKLDECLINKKGEYIPVDFKTSSSDPRDRETLPAYQAQIDAYLFLLAKNKKKIANFGYLIYFFPDHSKKLHEGFPMVIHVEKLKGSIESAQEKIARAIKVLEKPMPAPAKECEFCLWYDRVSRILEAEKEGRLF